MAKVTARKNTKAPALTGKIKYTVTYEGEEPLKGFFGNEQPPTKITSTQELIDAMLDIAEKNEWVDTADAHAVIDMFDLFASDKVALDVEYVK